MISPEILYRQISLSLRKLITLSVDFTSEEIMSLSKALHYTEHYQQMSPRDKFEFCASVEDTDSGNNKKGYLVYFQDSL